MIHIVTSHIIVFFVTILGVIDFSSLELSYFGHKITNNYCKPGQKELEILRFHEYLTKKGNYK